MPYVGAGVGVAYNETDDVSFTGNPALVNRIEGDDRWSLAWSLMAGVGWQVTERATLDIGYRYIDMGKAESGTIDNRGLHQPQGAHRRPHRARVQGRPALRLRRRRAPAAR